MKRSHATGFTLIELLTVLAIISILAAFIMAVGPAMLERAKLRRLDGALRQVATSLAAYYTDHGTYPPAYGYVAFEHAGNLNAPANPADDPGFYTLMPYMYRMRYHGDLTLYDEFSRSYDTTNDGRLSLLEFSPHGELQPDGNYQFDFRNWPRYLGQETPALFAEIDRQLNAPKRPFVYIPINKQQFARAQRYWLDQGAEYAQRWDPSDPGFPNLQFPPRTYDGFVLISVGPGGGTFGILPDPLGVGPEQANNYRDLYHITALRAYFMATRDLNANGQLDFDFRARTRHREAAPETAYEFKGRTLQNELPDPTAPFGYGPYIYVSQ